MSGLVSKYGTTTTDHYPVFTQFSFAPLIPTPVKLLDFTATRQGFQAKLTWTTTRENNTREFRIERSGDSIHFVTIGTVPANRYGHAANNYTFFDRQPLPVNYYRLKEVGPGKQQFDYSKTLKLDFPRPIVVCVAPNPAFNFVNISVQNATDAVKLQIISLNGRVVTERTLAPGVQTIRVDVSWMAKGIYTVKVISHSETAMTKLLVL